MKSKRNPKKQIAVLGLTVAGMFGFAYALVPLYEIFCEITGFGGVTFEQAVIASDV